jgi:putative multiple sugar transport system ATP-binding protein
VLDVLFEQKKGGVHLADIILEMKNITKHYPGVRALDNVSLSVERGEVHAIVGENGAGKSTLMNVLSGTIAHGNYEGVILYDGHECRFRSVRDGEKVGIVCIHQELALIPELSIGENMFLGNERKGRLGIDWDETYSQAASHLKQVGLKDRPTTLIKDIGTGKQQLVEIAKALSKNVKLLILDEPTSSLNEEEARMLLDMLLDFKKQGDDVYHDLPQALRGGVCGRPHHRNARRRCHRNTRQQGSQRG